MPMTVDGSSSLQKIPVKQALNLIFHYSSWLWSDIHSQSCLVLIITAAIMKIEDVQVRKIHFLSNSEIYALGIVVFAQQLMLKREMKGY